MSVEVPAPKETQTERLKMNSNSRLWTSTTLGLMSATHAVTILHKTVSQSCAFSKTKASKVPITALWPMKQVILFAKFDCPVARKNVLLVATARDCETGLL